MKAAKNFLTESEFESLVYAPLAITFENAIRFPADCSGGDVHFRIRCPDRNIYRCRTHLKSVYDMEGKICEMEKIIEKYSG